MGAQKKIARVVLDTNILVSSLLFHGEVSKVVSLWESGTIIPVISRETFHEFKKVLSYPKFALSEEEIRKVIADNILPFFEVVDLTEMVAGICRDADDDKFISCAVSASADYIVSGDRDLCDLRKYRHTRIISVKVLLDMFGSG